MPGRISRLTKGATMTTTTAAKPEPATATHGAIRKLLAAAAAACITAVALLVVALSDHPRTGSTDRRAAHAPSSATYQPLIHFRGTGAPPVTVTPNTATRIGPTLDGYPRHTDFHGAD
jgi:hypothetical protein